MLLFFLTLLFSLIFIGTTAVYESDYFKVVMIRKWTCNIITWWVAAINITIVKKG
ncbi:MULTISPECIES: hypothetical protein [unclassified Peribacillus]|uniref:hypothetical protein n=1 Tax=unclassified Peribacillus TaxID=2675266 RepID=UPI00366B89E6